MKRENLRIAYNKTKDEYRVETNLTYWSGHSSVAAYWQGFKDVFKTLDEAKYFLNQKVDDEWVVIE